jgi:S1-C subfamily serine protease
MRLRVLLIAGGMALAAAPMGATRPHAVPSGADWMDVSKRVADSLVYIEGDGGCSGFVIDAARHYVLSAAHCDVEHPTDRLWVDRVAGKVISKDTKKDLLVIEVKDLDPSRPALKLAAKNPSTGQEVMSIGFGYALERPFFRVAHVTDTEVAMPKDGIGGPLIGTDAAFVPGQSGGPVVDESGAVVAIVQMASDRVGLGVGAEIIHARTGRFWGQ